MSYKSALFLYSKITLITQGTLPIDDFPNPGKCQKAHSGIVSDRQSLGQARTFGSSPFPKKGLPALA